MKPQPQKPKPKRKQLTLAERVKVIQRKKNGDFIKTLQKAFDVGRTQITVILVVNNKMTAAGRRIIFIDNCPAHKLVVLSHVKVHFLPANTTSKLQPCDAHG